MVAGSILPITIHNDKLYFLFGKENELEKSAKGWSDFGGRAEAGETPYKAALREGSEELTGFLGNKNQIQKLINKNGGVFKITHNSYHVHMFFLKYDENLPKYFNKNHYFLWNNMNQAELHKTKLFEKIEIDWFSKEDIRRRRKDFRPFYKNILDLINRNIINIETFAKQKENI